MARSPRSFAAAASSAILALVGVAPADADTPSPGIGASRSITAAGPEGKLAGTLLLPATGEGPYETVLILPGSGPVDRDGNAPGAISAAPYRLLAEGLAGRGIASVRIDKRGAHASRAAGDGNDVTLDAYADDVESWLASIADASELSGEVWLAGHSEGALIATVTAARAPAAVRGIALLNAPGRPLGALLRDQLAAMPANAPILEQAFAAIETLERGGRVDTDSLHPNLAAGLFDEKVQGYLSELVRFDPAEALGALGEAEDPLPVLIVHGGRDLQIPDLEPRRLLAARPDAELVTIADMNHVMKRVATDDREANLATYADPHLPIVPAAVEAVADFVKRTRPGR